MGETLTISIKTLTPIWTGDVNGRCSEIKETGIIGSMRWWYEAIVRRLGGRACDPTERGCSLDINEYNNTTRLKKSKQEALHDGGLCDVCQVFGTTGWKKQFNLSIIQDNTNPAWEDDITLNIRPPQRNRGWFLPSGRTGSFSIRMDGDQDEISHLSSLFLFLESWGAIGAKSQLGYGFFRIINRNEVQEKIKQWTEFNPMDNIDRKKDWIFFRCRFDPSNERWWTRIEGIQRLMGDQKMAQILSKIANEGMIPISPVLRNIWRFERRQEDVQAKEWLFGTSKGDNRIRSKVAVSWAYRDNEKWVVRGWVMQEHEKMKKIIDQGEEINKFKKILKDESIWKKALNIDSSSDIQVISIKEKSDIVRFLNEKL